MPENPDVEDFDTRTFEERVKNVRKAVGTLKSAAGSTPLGQIQVTLSKELISTFDMVLDIAEREMFTDEELFTIFVALAARPDPHTEELAGKVNRMAQKRRTNPTGRRNDSD